MVDKKYPHIEHVEKVTSGSTSNALSTVVIDHNIDLEGASNLYIFLIDVHIIFRGIPFLTFETVCKMQKQGIHLLPSCY